jgi:hypothetical protein
MSIAPKMNDNSELQRLMQEAGKKIEEQGGLLSADETGRLQSLEAVIEKGRQTFIDVGMALTEIKEKRLWKGYGSFKGYLEKRWNFSRQYAYMQIEAYEAAMDVTTVVDTPNEKTAREFVKVPKEERPKVAETAKAVAAESGRETINSRDVKEAKKRIYDPTPKVVESIANEDDGEPIQPKDEEPAIEIVDDPEAWLEKLPLMDVLTGMPKRKYVEAAKLWVEMEPQMKQTAAAIRRASKAIPQHMHSRFMTRMLVSFIIDAPQHWTLCKPCNGTGQVPKIGACDVCRSDGFNISTSRTR